MKKIKIGLSLLLLLLSSITANAINGKALIVELDNGTKTTFVLSDHPTLTFQNRILKVEVDGKNMT